MVDLISAIIVLIVGIVLYAISRADLPSIAKTVCYWLGIALIIIGVILIVVAVLTGALGPGPFYSGDIDALVYHQAKALLA